MSIPSNPAAPRCHGPPLFTPPRPGEYRPRYICPPATEQDRGTELVHTLYHEVNWFILTQDDFKALNVNTILHHKHRVQKHRLKQFIFSYNISLQRVLIGPVKLY